MCKPASFVIAKGPKAYWLAKSDSHEEIIRSVELYESPQTNIVRTEIAPPNRDLSLPLDQWVYRVDQPNTPDWYDAESCERECRLALAEWAKAKLAGWKVHEAFHPINPLLLKAKRIPNKQLLKLLQSWASVWDSVGSVWASVWDSVGASVGDSVYGQHEAGWLSFYSYFREVCGLTTQTDSLRGLTSQAQAAGWFLPHAKICWVSERHNILRQDERGRLHDLSEPACAYPDGWAIYAVHGVRVPGWIIETPSEITPTKIDAEKNAEIRRVMMTKFGEAKYLEQSGAVEVSRDLRGVLYRKDIVGDEPLVMVRVENSTPETDGSAKPFWLRVPPGCKTAAEAVAWTFGVETHKYEPEVES